MKIRRIGLLIAGFASVLIVVGCGGGQGEPVEATVESQVTQAQATVESQVSQAQATVELQVTQAQATVESQVSQAQGTKPTPSPKLTMAPENVDVAQLVIDLPDLPEGFVLTEEKNTDNRESAKKALDPDADLKRMESWGRILGHEALYDKGFLEEHIKVFAVMYSTESGAAEAAAFYANEAEQRAQEGLERTGGTNFSFEELSELKVGDDTFAARVGGTVEILGTPRRLEALRISFRRGYVRTGVVWMSFDGGVLSDDVLELANKQDQLIESVLSGSAPAKSAAEIEPSAKVSAAELFAAYKDNPVAGDAEFKNKTVLITGHINRIVSGDYPRVIFEGGDLSLEVACYFGPRDIENLIQLREGQRITLKGTVTGKPIFGVDVRGCSVWESTRMEDQPTVTREIATPTRPASATPRPTYTPRPTATPTEIPFRYTYISTLCRPIVTHIAEFALMAAYSYPEVNINAPFDLLDIPSDDCTSATTDSLGFSVMLALFAVGALNLDLGMPIEGVSGTQSDIFGIQPWDSGSLEDIQEESDIFEVIGFLSEGVIKVKSPDADFPKFLNEMYFSDRTLTELNKTGLHGEELAKHYYKSYEDEWTTWFTGDEASHVATLKEAASSPP